VLIDEVNRARPEIKGALPQAMAEREVSIDTMTYQLEEPFLVLANQNPIEQEGTYPLVKADVRRSRYRFGGLSPSVPCADAGR
jgi:MoxR-like ATPase